MLKIKRKPTQKVRVTAFIEYYGHDEDKTKKISKLFRKSYPGSYMYFSYHGITELQYDTTAEHLASIKKQLLKLDARIGDVIER